MELGLFTCPYQYGDLEEAFVDAAEFRYDFIELWGGRPHAYCYDIINSTAEILSLIQKYGMPVRVYTPEHNAYPYNYMLGTDRQWEDCMEYFHTSLKAGKLLGAEYVLVSIGHGGNAEAGQRKIRLIKSMERFKTMAEKIGQKVIVETLTPFESNTCTSLDEYEELINTIDSPYILPMVDTVAPFVQKEDPADYIRRFGNKLTHIHLVDSDGISDTHLIPGEGIMNIRQVIGEMKKAGFDGTATIELVTHYISDPTHYSKIAIEKTKELLI